MYIYFLIADAGGRMGFILGGSVVSMCEILGFYIMTLFIVFGYFKSIIVKKILNVFD